MQQGNKDRAGTVTKRLIYPRFRLIQWACGLALTRAENENELQCCFWKMTAWRATTKFRFLILPSNASREYLASMTRCLSFHVHFFHFIQLPAGTIWHANKLPAATLSTLASWSEFLHCELPTVIRTTPTIPVALHLTCHLWKENHIIDMIQQRDKICIYTKLNSWSAPYWAEKR